MFEVPTETIEQQASELAEEIAIEDDALEQLSSELTRRKDDLKLAKEQLANLLIQAGLQSIKLQSGLSPKVKQNRKFFAVAGTSDEQLFGWLQGNDLGHIIKPTVNFNTLQATLKEFEEQGNQIPELFNIVTENTVTMYGKSKFLSSKGPSNEHEVS